MAAKRSALLIMKRCLVGGKTRRIRRREEIFHIRVP
jgi:hypothetical protein